MAATYEQIIDQLYQKKFSPLYLLMGEEPFFIDQISEIIEETALQAEERDFNQMMVYANDKEVDATSIVAFAREFPFGVPYRVVIVKEAKDLKKFEYLKNYAEHPSTSAILVICYKYGKLTATQSKPFEKNGIVFLSEKIKDNKLPDWIQKQAKLHHFQIDSKTAMLLSENIGNDLTRINNELLKLKIFLPPNSTITAEIIEKYIGISKEYNVFELQNALGEKNLKKCYKITLNMCNNIKENPLVKIIAVLSSFYLKMLSYHLAVDTSQETLTRIYGNMHPYVLKINTQYAAHYSFQELVKIIGILREYDVKSKGVGSVITEEELFKELIYKILN
jgi:DNA polymerase-3 subunit delta